MSDHKSLRKLVTLTIALALFAGCQKAKMKTVEKADSGGFRGERFVPDPDRDRDRDSPDADRDNDSTVIPTGPVTETVVPRPTNGEGGDPAPPLIVPGGFDPGPIYTPRTPRVVVHRVPEETRADLPDASHLPMTPVHWPRGGRTLSDLDRCYSEVCEPAPPIVVNPEDPDEVIPPDEYQCRPVDQPTTPITNKLDVLFVADTSDSIDSEKQRIARNIHRFVDELNAISNIAGYDQQIDFRMAVLLAHGPNTKTHDKRGFRTHGNLFVHKSESDDAKAVLGGIGRSQEHLDYIKQTLEVRFNGGLDTFDPSCDIDEPWADQQCIRDSSDTLGEAGLLALEKWLRDYKDHNHAQNVSSPDQVFPRDDAALMIVFVSDENDVCFDYHKWNTEPVSGRQRAYPFSQYAWNINNDFWNFQNQAAPAGAMVSGLSGIQSHTRVVQYPANSAITRDIYEHRAFVNPEVCAGPQRSEHIHLTVASLLERAKNWQMDRTRNHMPIIASGILLRTTQEANAAAAHLNQLYADTRDEAYKWFRDKERGWGYVNLIHAFQGTAASLNSTDFGAELAEIGKDATFVLTYQTELELIDTRTGEQLDLSNVQPGSLRVESVNREFINADGSMKPGAEIIHLNSASHFRLVYDTATTGHLRLDRQGIKDAGVEPGSKMFIYYRPIR